VPVELVGTSSVGKVVIAKGAASAVPDWPVPPAVVQMPGPLAPISDWPMLPRIAFVFGCDMSIDVMLAVKSVLNPRRIVAL
jgi:hypothetical protein